MTSAPNYSALLLRPMALISLVAIVAAVAGSAATGQAGAWLTFAFQLTIVVAGALGVLLGIGKLKDAPAMGALCVAGTFFVAGFLGYYGAGGNIAFRALLGGDFGAFNAGELPTWVLLVELGAAGLTGAISGLLAMGRAPREAWKQLILGIVLGAPVVVGGAAAYKMGLIGRITSLNMIVSTVIIVVLFALVVGLLSASGNAIIKAFSVGLPDLENPDAGGAKPAPATPAAASKAG